MLASVLNSPTAIEAGIKVVRAFVKMRSILALHQDLADLLMTDEEREKRYRKARREIEKFIRRNKGLKQSKAK